MTKTTKKKGCSVTYCKNNFKYITTVYDPR
jgi:hypothetical protein